VAVLTEVSDEQAAALLADYPLGELDALTGIAQGIENTNYKLMAGGRRYILTLFEGRTDTSALPYFLGLMEEAAAAGLPAPRPAKRKDGQVLGEVAGRPAAIVSFLPGRDIASPHAHDAEQVGRTLAALHLALAGTSLRRANDMGPDSWRRTAARLGPHLSRLSPSAPKAVEAVLTLYAQPFAAGLPMGAIHGDLFPDNLLVSHGEVTGIIDFYFACDDYWAYDLAVAMNAYTPEEGPDGGQAEALLSGYESVRALTSAEREALPVFLCGAALRFFLSRASDLVHPPQGALYRAKDPLPWLRLLIRRLGEAGVTP
jgi:homoserine kinase type II